MKEIAIKVSSVTKSYPGIDVLKNVSFEVYKNRIHGFLGPNGAGKSTTMKIITGLVRPNKGSVEVQTNQKIGYLPELPPLYQNLLVGDYLKFVQDIYAQDALTRADRILFYDRVIERCGLKKVEKRMIQNLSKGLKQRVGMASAIVFNPDVLVFDEPTVGLDPRSIIEIRELILELKEDHTILLSTHQLHEAGLLCDDLTIINSGQIVSSGTVDEITSELFTYKTLAVEVDDCSDRLIDFIKSKVNIKNILIEKTELGKCLMIETDEKEDIRPMLGKTIIEGGQILYGIREEKPDLEDVFKRATGDQL